MNSWRWESEWGSCYKYICFYTGWSEDLLACPWGKIILVFLASYWMISKAWIRQCSLNTVVEVGITRFMKLYFSPFGYVEKMEGKFGHTFFSLLISKFKSHLLWSEIWWDLGYIPNPFFIFLSFQLHTGKIISKKLSSFPFSSGELALC